MIPIRASFSPDTLTRAEDLPLIRERRFRSPQWIPGRIAAVSGSTHVGVSFSLHYEPPI